MAYLALARKWRPKVFSEVVGQQHVVQALSNALDSGRVHHAFLFTGTRGVGKTTLARIFAKSLNCEQGTSAEPCQQCSTCQSIDEGRFVDLIEVDAASRTKVDETRELLENVQYAPTSGKFKVYLIDEVHMLSGHSFNAMLKTLEEPPEHVKFLFATTDPQKLPVTILSRCLQFNLRAMRPEQVENQLVKILGNEGLDYDTSALHAIAKAADGSMRDGLSLLDQAIAQGNGDVRSADVQSMLGTIKTEHTRSLITALATNNVNQALQVVTDMADSAVDFTVALDEVLMQLYYISLAQVSPSSIEAADVNQSEISELANKVSPESVQLFYQIGLIGKRDIALAPSLRVGFEMALLRMFAFEPADNEPSAVPIPSEAMHSSEPAKEPAAQSDTAEKKTPENFELNPEQAISEAVNTRIEAPISTAPTEPTVDAGSVSEKALAVSSAANNQTPQHDTPPWEADATSMAMPDSEPNVSMIETELQSASNRPPAQIIERQMAVVEPPELASSQDQHSKPSATTAIELGGVVPDENNGNSEATPVSQQTTLSVIAVTLAGNNEWGELVEQTSLVGMAKELAMNCAADRINDERIDLCLSPQLEHLFEQDRFVEIQTAVKAAVGSDIQVKLDIDNSNRETPAECLSRLGYEHDEQVREQMHSDPGVKSIISEFGATIKENSIKPIS